MEAVITTPTVGEILREEFMEPMGISVQRLAEETRIPSPVVYGILRDQVKISPILSLLLARFFGVSDRYFLNIQNDIDIRKHRT